MLRERILELGYVLPGDILNVNAFLNHQLDTELLVQIGKTFAGHFSSLGVTKIITIETSGIAAAVTKASSCKSRSSSREQSQYRPLEAIIIRPSLIPIPSRCGTK